MIVYYYITLVWPARPFLCPNLSIVKGGKGVAGQTNSVVYTFGSDYGTEYPQQCNIDVHLSIMVYVSYVLRNPICSVHTNVSNCSYQ